MICLSKVKDALKIKCDLQDMDLVCKALLGLHCFTGCDTINAFSGKGKIKPLHLMLKNSCYINLFASIGEEPNLSEDLFQIAQQFVCEVYGYKEKNTNIVRDKLYATKQGHLDPKGLLTRCTHFVHALARIASCPSGSKKRYKILQKKKRRRKKKRNRAIDSALFTT